MKRIFLFRRVAYQSLNAERELNSALKICVFHRYEYTSEKIWIKELLYM
jgi:hypothetical protein